MRCGNGSSGTAILKNVQSGKFNGCWCIRTVAEISSDNKRIKHKIKNSKQLFLNFIEGLVRENKPELSKAKQDKLAKRIYILYESAVSESHLQEELWPIEESMDLLKSLLKELKRSK